MQKRTRLVNAKARVTLFSDFAGCTIMLERRSPDEILIRKIGRRRRKYSLAKLVAGITKKNRHDEIVTGQAVGGEM